jgi:SAM-dependent methyltransferase
MYDVEETHWWFVGLRELVLSSIGESESGDLQILDAGCGTGGLMERLRSLGTVTGFEFRETALNFCSKRGLANIIKTDLNSWEPKNDSYDVIICLDVLSDEGVRNDKAVLQKFEIALKPGGKLILNLPAFPILRRKHDIAATIRKRYKKKDFSEVARNTGLKTECIRYRLFHLFPIALVIKLLGLFTSSKEKGGATQTDMSPPSPWLNACLLLANRIDNSLIRAGVPLPYGMSLFAILRKA